MDEVTYLKEREMTDLRGKGPDQGIKCYKRRKRKNIPFLFYYTEKRLLSIQRDLTLLSTHRQV